MGQSSEFQLTEEDFVAANYLRLGWWRTLVAVGVLVAIAAARELWAMRDSLGHITFGPSSAVTLLLDVLPIALGLLAISFVLRRLLVPWQSGRIYRQQKSLRRPRKISWDDDRLTTEGADFVVHTPWSDFRNWRQDDKIFALYVTDRKFQIIPKRAFANESDLAEFGRLARAKIAPNAGARHRES